MPRCIYYSSDKAPFSISCLRHLNSDRQGGLIEALILLYTFHTPFYRGSHDFFDSAIHEDKTSQNRSNNAFHTNMYSHEHRIPEYYRQEGWENLTLEICSLRCHMAIAG